MKNFKNVPKLSPKIFLNLFKLCNKVLFYLMAHLTGVEPIAFWSVVRRSIQLSYRCMYIFSILLLKKNGGEGGIWTLDPSFSPDTPLAGERIRPLCHFSKIIQMAGELGFEPRHLAISPVFKTGPLAVRTSTHTLLN